MPRQSSPAQIKLLRGATPGRINAEPKPRDLPPEPPEYLDERARLYFLDLVEQAEPMGTICRLDSPILGLLADAYSRADKAREYCRRSLLTMGSDGQPKRHPAGLILHEAIGDVIRLSRELGLSPAVRHSLSVGAKRDDDGSERLLD